jgi:hypothetical protein
MGLLDSTMPILGYVIANFTENIISWRQICRNSSCRIFDIYVSRIYFNRNFSPDDGADHRSGGSIGWDWCSCQSR